MADYDGAGAAGRDDDPQDPQEELRELLREILSGGGGFDPERLAGVAGLPQDPAAVRQFMARMQEALNHAGPTPDWNTALEQARQVARPQNREVDEATRERFAQAARLAELWLGETTRLGGLLEPPATITRLQWIAQSMPFWSQVCEPVARSISDALMGVLRDQAPPEMAEFVEQSDGMMRGVGGALFAVQLGQVVGRLAAETVSGGDIGVPVLERSRPVLLPQNVEAFGAGLDLDPGEVELYLSVRELAHARLFQHAKWLRLHLVTAVTEFARGITIDVSRIEELAEELDPQDPETIRAALESGRFIPPRTPGQEAALARIETMLALIEGWVDVVTEDATARLPRAAAIAESVRRRRATGGPAEHAFASLVGLELRPRRLREAAAMWRAVTEAHGPAARDALWEHFDAVPGSEDIDHPEVLVQRLAMGRTAPDDMDEAIASLLQDPDAFGQAPSSGAAAEGEEPGEEDEEPESGPATA